MTCSSSFVDGLHIRAQLFGQNQQFEAAMLDVKRGLVRLNDSDVKRQHTTVTVSFMLVHCTAGVENRPSLQDMHGCFL